MTYAFGYGALTIVAALAVATAAQAEPVRPTVTNTVTNTGATAAPRVVTTPPVRVVPATWLALGALSNNSTAYLRLTNAGNAAGTATVTLYSAGTGAELGTYTSASVAPLASLQVDMASIIAGATPTLTASQTSGGLTAAVRATFHGNVQTLALTNGALSNLTTCPGLDGVIGGVPGPNHVDLTGSVRVFNASTLARTATLTLYNSATGSKLGTWTSASVPARGSLTVSTTGLFAAITLAAGTSVPTLTLQAGRLNAGVQVDVFAQPKAGGPATNLEPRCALVGGLALGRSAAARENDAADQDAGNTSAAD